MKKILWEFISSFSYLFLGCLIELLVINFLPIYNFILELFIIAFSFGVVFGLFYTLINKIVAIEINPIFSFSLWLRNQMTGKEVITTILSQLLGGVFASGILFLIFPQQFASLGVGYGDASFLQASLDTIILIELLFSFLFVFCFLIAKDKKELSQLRGMFLGTLLFLLIFFSIGYTGCCVNPIRAVTVNLFVNEDYLRQSVFYLLSSLAGSLLATILYHVYSYISNRDSLQHF